MEASAAGPRGAGTGAREADIAPAADPTAGRSAGWTPADPGPLGLAAFAGTTFVLSLMNSNLVSITGIGSVLALALAYGGIAQLVAGIWEFRTGNTFGAVAFCSFGAFWISYFVLIRLIPAAAITPHGVSAYLWMWAIFTTYMFFASLRTTGAVALVFLPAGDHVRPARVGRHGLRAHEHPQSRRMGRARHRDRGLVCLVCGSHELDLGACRAAGLP